MQIIPATIRNRLFTLGGSVIALVGVVATFGGGFFEDAADDIENRPALFALVFLGLILVAVANLDWIRGVLGLQSPVHFGRIYREWLHAAKYGVTDSTTPDSHFAVSAKDPQGRAVTLQITKRQPSRLHFSTGFGLVKDEISESALSKMDPQALDAVAARLQLEMARYGVLYAGLKPPFERVVLTTSAVADVSLDEYRFFEKLDYIRNAHVLFSVLFDTGMNLAIASIAVEPADVPEEESSQERERT